MKVGLFIPCYIDQFYPEVGKATVALLKDLGVAYEYPMDQTCCGQPLANGGFAADTKKMCSRFASIFQEYDHIVSPSGSCVYHVKEHYDHIPQNEAVRKVRSGVIELCDFLVNVLKVRDLNAYFPHKVGLHKSCHGLRGLKLGAYSEKSNATESVMETLLNQVEGLELMPLDRHDECCGFGGTFSIHEEAVSVKMGKDRIQDHLENNVEVITGTDTSCLMHLDGLIRRNDQPIKTMHIVQILSAKKQVSP
jgi:L-lactate dehydrogenase complex protein LldE